MEHGRKREMYSNRVSANDKSSPLLNPNRKNHTSEKSSLSESFEVPKSYGTTRNPLHPQCKVKLIGHVLEATDTLQGLAIKYGVTAEHLRRVNKLWANDSIHLLKILKIPLNIDSQYYAKYVELSGNGFGPDEGINTEDELSNHVEVQKGKHKVGILAENSVENSNEFDSKEEDKLSAVSYLDKLDARIKSSTQESEKLRTVSGPKLIADVEKASKTSLRQEDDLFRPLSTETPQSHRGQRLTSGRHKWKVKRPFQDELDDKFFQL